MAPGPTPVPPDVARRGAAPIIHHRGPDFRELMLRTLDRLQQVCRTQQRRPPLHGVRAPARSSRPSSTCSRRASACSSSRPGSSAIAGAKLARAFGATSTSCGTPGARRRSRTISECGSTRPARRSSFVVHSETSTGVVADVRGARGCVPARRARLVVVDAVSSLGAVPLETDAWGLDVVVAGSQKALMTPPGLSLVDRLAAAWERSKRATLPRFYFDWETHADGARDRLDALHARRVDRRRARRRARAAPRGGSRRRVRAPRRARPRVPRGREGDGARAVLAGRGAVGRRDGDPHARRGRRPRARARAPRPLRDHRRRERTGSSARGCSASGTSATTTCSTSRPPSPRWRRCSSSAARTIERGRGGRARARGVHDAARV